MFAATALGEIGDERTVEPLIKALKSDDFQGGFLGEYHDLQDEAMMALVKIGAPSLEPLILLLKDKDFGTRKKAAEALGKMGDKRAVEPLIQIMNDTNDEVRNRVIRAFGEIGDKRAVEPLTQALDDDYYVIREVAQIALDKI